MRPVMFGVAVAAGVLWFGAGSQAKPADVTAGEGVVVVDLTPAESKKLFEAVDSAAAFAAMVAPALPPDYQAAVKLAGTAWGTLRLILPKDGIPLRVVVSV